MKFVEHLQLLQKMNPFDLQHSMNFPPAPLPQHYSLSACLRDLRLSLRPKSFKSYLLPVSDHIRHQTFARLIGQICISINGLVDGLLVTAALCDLG